VDVFEKGFDVIGSLQPVIDHKGMLKDIQYQNGCAAGRVADVVFIDPEVDEPSGE
jgi:hypothetical protein